MTPHDPRAEVVLTDVLVGVGYPATEYHAEVPRMVEGIKVRQQLDALTAAGLHVVPEGHAVIDGEVVELCTRCDHDEWWHSITGEGFCVDACGCHGFVPPGGGAPDTEGRPTEKEARDG